MRTVYFNTIENEVWFDGVKTPIEVNIESFKEMQRFHNVNENVFVDMIVQELDSLYDLSDEEKEHCRTKISEDMKNGW